MEEMLLSLLHVFSHVTGKGVTLQKCTTLELKYAKYRTWPYLPKPAQTQIKSEKRS